MNRRGFIRGMLAAAALAAVPFKWAFKQTSKVFTGARARIFINGKLIAYTGEVTVSYDPKDLSMHTIGQYKPEEVNLGPVEFTATVTRVVKGSEWDKLMSLSDEDREALLNENPPVRREDIT